MMTSSTLLLVIPSWNYKAKIALLGMRKKKIVRYLRNQVCGDHALNERSRTM